MDAYPKALSTIVTDALGRKVRRAVVWPDGHLKQIAGAPVIFLDEAQERAYGNSGVPASGGPEQTPQQQPVYPHGVPYWVKQENQK
jgi:hypothetical protein